MNSKVTLDLYRQDEDQPFHEQVLTDFDELREQNDKIYSGTLPDGTRVFVHVQVYNDS